MSIKHKIYIWIQNDSAEDFTINLNTKHGEWEIYPPKKLVSKSDMKCILAITPMAIVGPEGELKLVVENPQSGLFHDEIVVNFNCPTQDSQGSINMGKVSYVPKKNRPDILTLNALYGTSIPGENWDHWNDDRYKEMPIGMPPIGIFVQIFDGHNPQYLDPQNLGPVVINR